MFGGGVETSRSHPLGRYLTPYDVWGVPAHHTPKLASHKARGTANGRNEVRGQAQTNSSVRRLTPIKPHLVHSWTDLEDDIRRQKLQTLPMIQTYPSIQASRPRGYTSAIKNEGDEVKFCLHMMFSVEEMAKWSILKKNSSECRALLHCHAVLSLLGTWNILQSNREPQLQVKELALRETGKLSRRRAMVN